jgi:hypothetical protein
MKDRHENRYSYRRQVNSAGAGADYHFDLEEFTLHGARPGGY